MEQNKLSDFFLTHDLKTWPTSFDAIERGDKNHEVRFNDRDFKVGDFLRLKKWFPRLNIYTGRELIVRVTYCGDLGVYYPELVGFVSMSIERIKK